MKMMSILLLYRLMKSKKEYIEKLSGFMGFSSEDFYEIHVDPITTTETDAATTETDETEIPLQYTNIIIDIKTKYSDGIAIISLLSGYTSPFLIEYNTQNMDKEKYPVFIFGYNDISMIGEEFIGHYGICAYEKWNDYYEENKSIRDKINEYSGKIENILSESFIVIYNTINILSQAILDVNDISDTDNIKDMLYTKVFTSPQGTVKITKSNYATSHVLIVKIKEGKNEIIMQIPFTIMPIVYHQFVY